MIALGIGLGWLGYALAWRGYSMVMGWDLSLSDIVSPTKYYGKGQQAVKWPPAIAPNTIIFPNGQGGKNATAGQPAASIGAQVKGLGAGIGAATQPGFPG